MSAVAPEFIHHPLADGYGPAWASEWGEDPEFGPFAVLECPSKDGGPPVRVRWRWIPPGEFKMGSPESEDGRYSDEGPCHRVRLTHGFWMMSTVCTQSFWEAVLGADRNPSEFRGGDRPVENVSWEDVQAFVLGLESEIPGLGASLPTESQWEYACRAGSTGALYRIPGTLGTLEIIGKNNGPELDAIAWYGGNSGEGFELANGADSRSWPEKQYEHESAGAHPVGRKLPNAWGLYDMLGNVWEWCLDGQRDYSSASIADPVGPSVGSRVLRGGSWFRHARDVRCAFRGQSSPEVRDNRLGFRRVRVQE